MTSGQPASGPTTEAARESAEYADRIRRTNERLALSVAGLLAIFAFLPITLPEHRTGVFATAFVLFVIALVWFRVVPSTAFGERRVLVFGLLTQPVTIVLLSLTGGSDSPYLPFFLLPVLTTIYSPRTRHTLVIGVVSALSLLVVAFVSRSDDPLELVASRLATDLLELAAIVLFTAYAGRALREARRSITVRAETLAGEREEAMNLAFTDALTGLYNRRYAQETLKRLVREAMRGRPFTVLALDLDGLKQINDARGHATGDRVLARVGELLRLALRGADLPVRVGGDEFLALLPGTREEQGRVVGERLRAAVADSDWSFVGSPVSVSVGAAEWHGGQSDDDVVKAADADLYSAKRRRRPS
jgi:diguanylate cyclase (GGDEF)-like protein